MTAEPVTVAVAGSLRCRAVATPAERVAHLAIRHEVFVVEQALFAGSDRDARDERPGTEHVLAWLGAVPCGTVRLYPLAADEAPEGLAGQAVWQGDRLAVLPRFRSATVGAPLVRHAVARAGALGGEVMVAHIQLANVAFFRRLGWQPAGAVETYVGHPHQPMAIALPG